MLPNMYQVFIFPTKYVSSFYFSQVDKNTIKNEIKNLEISKAIQDSGITVKCLKQNAEFFAEQICCQFNEATCSSVLPASFKLANIAPVFKVGSRNQKDNYRSVSILPIFAKIFEKLISPELASHFDNIFSRFQFGFRKGYGTNHCL